MGGGGLRWRRLKIDRVGIDNKGGGDDGYDCNDGFWGLSIF